MLHLIDRLGQELRSRISLLTTPRSRTRVVHTQVNGYELLVRANEDVGRAIYHVGNFETLETRFLQSVIEPQSVCFDIGANCGYFAMLMAQRAPQGHVHAFEPLPLNAALLQASAVLNRFENITLNQSAVGNEDGHVTFVQAEDSAYSSMLDTARKGVAQRLEVPIVKLDSYCAAAGVARVDVLKADIEGAEGLMLDGATALLSDPMRRPTAMMIELYEPSLAIFGSSVSEIIERLTALGYRAATIQSDLTLAAFDPVRDAASYNIVFTAGR